MLFVFGRNLFLSQKVTRPAIDCIQTDYILATQARDRSCNVRLSFCSLTEITRYFRRQPGTRRFGH
jgi:hypothetical protein